MSKWLDLSTSHETTETFQRNYPCVHRFPELPNNSRRILSSVARVSGTKFCPCGYCHESSSSPSTRKGTSLSGAGSMLHVFYTTPQLSRGRRTILGVWPHPPTPQPSPRSLTGGVPCSFHPNGAVPGKYLEQSRPYNGTPRRAIAGCTESMDMRDVFYIPGVKIGMDGQQQEVVDSPLSHNRRVGEDMHALTPGILHDADLLIPIASNILDESILYNRAWTSSDMIKFNGILIDESEIVCQWVGLMSTCNERVRVKNIKIHLAHKHGIQSDLQLYRCSWSGCSVKKPMTHHSLARHVRERHSSVKWACPTCDETFTREHTLLGHFKRCSGRSALQACTRN